MLLFSHQLQLSIAMRFDKSKKEFLAFIFQVKKMRTTSSGAKEKEVLVS